MRLDDDTSGESWLLTPAELVPVMAKNRANRLGFALLLLFYRNHARFPPSLAEIDAEILAQVAQVAQQLGVEPELQDRYDPSHRTWKRCRAEIRALFGFREATVADAEHLEAWLCDQAISVGGNPDRLAALLMEHCRKLAIEPPTADRADRIVRAVLRTHDERVYAGILARLPPPARSRLEGLLRPADSSSDDAAPEPSTGTAPAVLLRLRHGPGRPSLASVLDELAKLTLIREIGLPADLFDAVPPHDLAGGLRALARPNPDGRSGRSVDQDRPPDRRTGRTPGGAGTA